MTEVKCGTSSVPLDAAAEFTGDAALVLQVARFKPFTEWCQRLKGGEGVKVKRLEVVSVGMVVGRMNSVTLRAELESDAGGKVWQSLTLCDDQCAALWVTVPLEEPAAILVSGPAPAIVSDDQPEVPFGTFDKMFDAPYADLLAQLGLDLNASAMRHLAKEAAVAPGAVGAQAHKFLHLEMQISAGRGASFAEQFPITDGDYTLHLVPLADIPVTTTSTRTLAALALYERERASA
eukprot:TRINITY_DN32422_c0_g1_i1.p1 TRINITY_DN32422_c0_g1~~TRINITY_DN32422_c0_g1_i1.p1  ORF type:complete len:235 (+),score=100.53 TRINITY_DN32422_c0_g1_i1:73-777(+)